MRHTKLFVTLCPIIFLTFDGTVKVATALGATFRRIRLATEIATNTLSQWFHVKLRRWCHLYLFNGHIIGGVAYFYSRQQKKWRALFWFRPRRRQQVQRSHFLLVPSTFLLHRRTLRSLIFVAAVLMFFSGLEARGLPFPPPISQNHIRCASSFVVAFIAFLSKKINISITGADFDTYIASFATWFSLHQCCFYGFLIEYRHWRHCRLVIPILYNSGWSTNSGICHFTARDLIFIVPCRPRIVHPS